MKIFFILNVTDNFNNVIFFFFDQQSRQSLISEDNGEEMIWKTKAK
jgi:hypothetical protein